MKKLLLAIIIIISCNSTSAQTALNFDGVNDFVLGTNNTSLNLTQGTIEAWVKTDNAGNDWRAIINKQGSFGVYLYDNKLAIWDMGNWNGIYTTINLADNTWHHITYSFSSYTTNGAKLYVDGNLVYTTTVGVPISANNIIVGASKGTSGYIQNFTGEIDQVRIWNYVRTYNEIKLNYDKCISGSESGLVMLWDFNEGTGLTVNDASGNNNNGTLTNMDATTNWFIGYNCIPQNLVAYYPFNNNANDESGNSDHGTVYGATLTADKDGNANSAFSFDGVDDYIKCLQPGPLGNASRTITFWAKTDYYPDYKAGNVVLTYGVDPTSFDYGGRFDIELNSKIVGLGFEVAGGELAKSFNNLDNQWHFYAVVFDNTTGTNLTDAKLYADGNLLTNQTYYNNVNPVINTKGDNPIHIGTLWNYNGVNFIGSLDELKIYNKALTTDEILAEYNTATAGITDFEQIQTNFYVYNNTLYFKNTQNLSEIKTFEVYNLLGQKVFETSEIKEEIQLNSLQIGMYILKVEKSNGNYSTLKFLIDTSL